MLLCITCANASAKLQINEIMQSNISLIYDELNDYPDSWVELHNSGNTEISLQDYSIGVKEKASKAYQLPDIKVAPGGFIVIYADKAGEGLHASFRIDSGKGGLLDATKSLVITLPEGTPNGTIIRYSLDCSNVTEQSPVYNGTPIEINANTIVRARLFHDDYLSPFTQHKATYSIQGNSNSP